MEQTNQPKTQRDRSTTFALPPTRSTPDPLETPASRSPRQSRFERLREVYETLSCANEDTDATADAIALNDLNASQPAPAGPCTNDPSTSTNAKNSSETTRSSTSIRTRIGRLFAQAQPSTHPTPRLRLLPNISISRLSFLHHGRGSSSSMSMPNTHIVYSSDGRAVFEYDPYTRNADEEADKADRANNDDTGGLMVLDGPADDDPAPWPQATRPAPGRTDSYASSLALLRWEASQPGSPYPSPFRPGLATLTLKRQRERREARQREQQAAAEEERKTRRRSVSASAALMSAAEEDDDGAYAAALASLDNPRSASASAVLMNDDDADDDGVYAAALANMPLPMPVPPETDEIVVGAIEALREECEGEAMRQRSRRGGVLAKLKQDVQNMKPRARGGADSGSKKKLFRRTW
ncbi:hypothetical protein BKA80DRAFT_299053 [Phyllosticta citrichinensis]